MASGSAQGLAEKWGFANAQVRCAANVTLFLTAIAAIAGVAAGAMALYGAYPAPHALWIQAGSLAGIGILTGITIAMSAKFKGMGAKCNVLMAAVTLLALPVLFGTLGAYNIIPAKDMLWAATSMCGVAVAITFFIFAGKMCSDCGCCPC